MPFQGSSKLLSSLIVKELQPLLNPDADPSAQERLRKTADALARAIEQWILQSGKGSVIADVAPGIPVATAGSPTSQTGATTAPGKIISPTSSLV